MQNSTIEQATKLFLYTDGTAGQKTEDGDKSPPACAVVILAQLATGRYGYIWQHTGLLTNGIPFDDSSNNNSAEAVAVLWAELFALSTPAHVPVTIITDSQVTIGFANADYVAHKDLALQLLLVLSR